MQTNHGRSEALKLGEVIAAAYELSSSVARDRAMVADLAARHLERVLTRGANRRLVTALADLARELAPTRGPSARSKAMAGAVPAV